MGHALLDDLMPWSETYRKYEQEQAAQDASLAIGGGRPSAAQDSTKERQTAECLIIAGGPSPYISLRPEHSGLFGIPSTQIT